MNGSSLGAVALMLGLGIALSAAAEAGCSDDSSSPSSSTGDASDASAASDAAPADAAAATDAATDGGDTSPSGVIVWKDDGTQDSADGTAEALVAGGVVGFALNVADAAHGNNLSLNVVAASPGDWKAGTFACPSPASAGYVHSPSGGVSYSQATCSITVTQVGAIGGAHLKGTFQVTLNVSSGGTKALTEGSFDVAYKN